MCRNFVTQLQKLVPAFENAQDKDIDALVDAMSLNQLQTEFQAIGVDLEASAAAARHNLSRLPR